MSGIASDDISKSDDTDSFIRSGCAEAFTHSGKYALSSKPTREK